eukprot:scaffold105750_cov73-Attheya_sp.AAC.1
MVSIWYDTSEFDSAVLTGLNLTEAIDEFSMKATNGAGGKVFLHNTDPGVTFTKACAPSNPLSRYCTSTKTIFGSSEAPFFYVKKAQSQQQQQQQQQPQPN